MSPETLIRIDELRNKARAGKIDIVEYREAIRLMREERVGASIASANSRAKKAAKGPVNADELLKDFM